LTPQPITAPAMRPAALWLYCYSFLLRHFHANGEESFNLHSRLAGRLGLFRLKNNFASKQN